MFMSHVAYIYLRQNEEKCIVRSYTLPTSLFTGINHIDFCHLIVYVTDFSDDYHGKFLDDIFEFGYVLFSSIRNIINGCCSSMKGRLLIASRHIHPFTYMRRTIKVVCFVYEVRLTRLEGRREKKYFFFFRSSIYLIKKSAEINIIFSFASGRKLPTSLLPCTLFEYKRPHGFVFLVIASLISLQIANFHFIVRPTQLTTDRPLNV